MSGTTVLIVEDEEITALDVEMTLSRLGYRVLARAASGDDAIALVAQHQPDIILMDIQLRGELDGIATAELIRKSYIVPIVYLTAHTEIEVLERAQQTEPFGYVLKPLDERSLHATLDVALHRHRAEQKMQEALAKEKDLQTQQSNFITTVSHEFRTPLSKILLATEALEHYSRDVLDEDKLRRFRLIKEGVAQITSLLENTVGQTGLQASYSDFEKLEIRVGRVIRAERFEKAKKPSFKLWIDFGELGMKKSSAQITCLYSPEELIGRLVMAVTNFPPRQIADFMSEVLVLGVVQPDASVVLVQPDREVPLGCRLL